MASNYSPNRWELYNPDIPNENQPHSFITKRKLDRMEKGIEEANVELEVGEISVEGTGNVWFTEDQANKRRLLNVSFPPAGKGDPGDPGKSAYELWLEQGNIGTEQEFLDYLKGIDGKDGKDGLPGKDGEAGPKGESAYQTWIAAGNTGTEEDFLNSIKGKSAYQIWLEAGNTGTEEDFFNAIKGAVGPVGPAGDSAYEVWKKIPGNENKTVNEFFESLKGDKGDPGEDAETEFVDFGLEFVDF